MTNVAWSALLFLLAMLVARPAVAESPPETREVMREIFAAFVTLMGRADSEEHFADPAARAEILSALRAIRERADGLERGGLTPAHASVRRSLAQDSAAASEAVAEGRFEGARFIIGQMAEDCFGCHSKLPADRQFELGGQLMETLAVRSLPDERRAIVAVAARRFEDAARIYESMLKDRSRSAIQIALSGTFEHYLKIVLRVLDDPARVLRALAGFRARSDLPVHLVDEVDAWITSLQAEPDPRATGLVAGRRAVREGQLRTVHPGDRRGLIQFVLASRSLYRYVQVGSHSPEELSEAFYLLGLCETNMNPSYWLSEAEDFLESSVRASPASVHARHAYAILESVYTLGFTGSAGTHLPEDVERKLEELRQLVQGG